MIEAEAPALEPRTTKGPAAGAALLVDGLGKTFETRAGELVALSGVSFECRPGETVALVGPSGCGKSTLLELVCGLEQPSTGTIAVDGHTAAGERLARCALMPQQDLLLPWRTALDNAGLALELAGRSRAQARLLATPLFERFGLAGFARERPQSLSGGMRQRVAFLRTLLAGKPLLALDEPFGALDAITRAEMQEWLAAALAGEPRTVLLVTHDVEEALFLADRVIVLSARPGRLRDEISVDLDRARLRREVVTSGAFAALKERALEALT